MTLKSTISETKFINIQVIVMPKARPGDYDVICNPELVTVQSLDTVINYQIIDPSPEGIKFSGVEIKPDHNHQLSQPSISVSGKLLTFSDANTIKETMNVTLRFIDNDGHNFGFDPQIANEGDSFN